MTTARNKILDTTDEHILCPSVVSLLAIVLFYCVIWSHDHQVE